MPGGPWHSAWHMVAHPEVPSGLFLKFMSLLSSSRPDRLEEPQRTWIVDAFGSNMLCFSFH